MYNIGLGTIRWGPTWTQVPYPPVKDCFFEACNSVPASQLMPLDVIIDFCNTFDLDGSGDIMPEVAPIASGHFEIDGAGDIMPEAV